MPWVASDLAAQFTPSYVLLDQDGAEIRFVTHLLPLAASHECCGTLWCGRNADVADAAALLSPRVWHCGIGPPKVAVQKLMERSGSSAIAPDDATDEAHDARCSVPTLPHSLNHAAPSLLYRGNRPPSGPWSAGT